MATSATVWQGAWWLYSSCLISLAHSNALERKPVCYSRAPKVWGLPCARTWQPDVRCCLRLFDRLLAVTARPDWEQTGDVSWAYGWLRGIFTTFFTVVGL